MKRRGSTYIQPSSGIIPGGGPIYITLYCASSAKVGAYGQDPGNHSQRLAGLNDLWQRGIYDTNELNGADFYRYRTTFPQSDLFLLVGSWPQFSSRPISQAGGMEWNTNLNGDDVFGVASGGTNFNAVVVKIKELTGWTGRSYIGVGTPIFSDISFNTLRWLYRNMNGSYSPFSTGYTLNQQIDVSNWYNVYMELPYGNLAQNFTNNHYSYAIKIKQTGGGAFNRQQGKVNGIYIG